MLKLVKENQMGTDKVTVIALGGRPAVQICDGYRRWLEEGQTVEFVHPQFKGNNAEFHINNQSDQSIWFSQLSQVAMAKDLKTPLYSTITLKGECVQKIAEKFKNAAEFWDATRNKRFHIAVLDTGFIVNTQNSKANMLMSGNSAKGSNANTRTSQKVFDYVLTAIKLGRDSEATGMIKKYVIYSLTEI